MNNISSNIKETQQVPSKTPPHRQAYQDTSHQIAKASLKRKF